MPKTVVFHSYRGGSGASNLTANLALILAMRGARVGVIDADIYCPGLHLLFGLPSSALKRTFNDGFLWDECSIAETIYDAANLLSDRGRLFLVPSSATLPTLNRLLKQDYASTRFRQASEQLGRVLDLDYLLIDTYPGIDTPWITFADQVFLVSRPDQQDFQGMAMLMSAWRTYRDRDIAVILNQVVSKSNTQLLRDQIERAYRIPVTAILPWSEDMAQMGSNQLFCLQHPEHALIEGFRSIATAIVN